uniref:Uncharacterized protein n=1 Tax=Zea mays TaxID=4577 RepID=C4J0D1_MAIZE|nr:unknown [Zea mays]
MACPAACDAYSGGTQMPPRTTSCGAAVAGAGGAGIGRRVCSLYFWRWLFTSSLVNPSTFISSRILSAAEDLEGIDEAAVQLRRPAPPRLAVRLRRCRLLPFRRGLDDPALDDVSPRAQDATVVAAGRGGVKVRLPVSVGRVLVCGRESELRQRRRRAFRHGRGLVLGEREERAAAAAVALPVAGACGAVRALRALLGRLRAPGGHVRRCSGPVPELRRLHPARLLRRRVPHLVGGGVDPDVLERHELLEHQRPRRRALQAPHLVRLQLLPVRLHGVVEELHAEGELALEGVDLEPLLLQAREELPELLRRLLRRRQMVVLVVVVVSVHHERLLRRLRDRHCVRGAVAVAVGLVV